MMVGPQGYPLKQPEFLSTGWKVDFILHHNIGRTNPYPIICVPAVTVGPCCLSWGVHEEGHCIRGVGFTGIDQWSVINVCPVPSGTCLIHSIAAPRRMVLKHQKSAEGKALNPLLGKMHLSEEEPMSPRFASWVSLTVAWNLESQSPVPDLCAPRWVSEAVGTEVLHICGCSHWAQYCWILNYINIIKIIWKFINMGIRQELWLGWITRIGVSISGVIHITSAKNQQKMSNCTSTQG